MTYLKEKGIPSMIYYPIPLYKQKAYAHYGEPGFTQPETERLCTEVVSLPIHTEMENETLAYIIHEVKSFFDC